MGTTIAIDAKQQRILDRINDRLDRLDAAAAPTVAAVLSAAHKLPPADRLAIHRRLSTIGAPNTEWASALR